MSEAAEKGWCDCVWDFPGHVDGALCKTCGHMIHGIELAKAANAFDVLTKHAKACNVRKAIKIVR